MMVFWWRNIEEGWCFLYSQYTPCSDRGTRGPVTSEWSLSDCLHRRPGDEFDLGYLFGVKRNCVRTERGVYNPCSDYNLSFIQRKRRKTSEKRKCSVSGSNIHENNIAPTHSIKVCEMQSCKSNPASDFPVFLSSPPGGLGSADISRHEPLPWTPGSPGLGWCSSACQ